MGGKKNVAALISTGSGGGDGDGGILLLNSPPLPSPFLPMAIKQADRLVRFLPPLPVSSLSLSLALSIPTP